MRLLVVKPLIILALLLVTLAACLEPAATGTGAGETRLPAGPSPTPTLCPQATPEPLWVDPVTSPTGALTQTIVIYIGNGEWAEVVMETGTYTQTGDFGAQNNPAEIDIDLLAGQTHHLTVSGRVKAVQVGGCTYGGYTLTTQLDRDGQPLVIVQDGAASQVFLPFTSRWETER